MAHHKKLRHRIFFARLLQIYKVLPIVPHPEYPKQIQTEPEKRHVDVTPYQSFSVLQHTKVQYYFPLHEFQRKKQANVLQSEICSSITSVRRLS